MTLRRMGGGHEPFQEAMMAPRRMSKHYINIEKSDKGANKHIRDAKKTF
jgi:hypothetical protein